MVSAPPVTPIAVRIVRALVGTMMVDELGAESDEGEDEQGAYGRLSLW